MNGESPDGRERVGWVWAIGCTLAGAAILAITIAEDHDALPGVLCEIGTALFLAAALFFLARRFTRQVAQASRHAIVEAAEGIEDRLQQQTEALSRRVDDLQAQVQQRLDESASQQDQKVAALKADVSRDNLIDVMSEAIELHAIRWGSVTVPGSADPAGMALNFACMMENRQGRASSGAEPLLFVEPRIGYASAAHGIRLTWRPSQRLPDVAVELSTRLQSAGLWQGPSTINWNDVRTYLHQSLELALTSRRRDGAPGN